MTQTPEQARDEAIKETLDVMSKDGDVSSVYLDDIHSDLIPIWDKAQEYFVQAAGYELPEIFESCAHPQSVWFEEHWRPIIEKQSATIGALKAENQSWKQLHENNEACINNQHKEIARLRALNEELDKANIKLASENYQLASRCNDFNDEVNRVQTELAEKRAHIKDIEYENADMGIKIFHMMTELEGLAALRSEG